MPLRIALATILLPLAARLVAQELPHTEFRLDNGLQVILHEDKTLPLVSLNLWYYVGSKDEPRGRSGFAHLFEHLMFMGTEAFPYPAFDTRIEEAGGSNNATTSTDRTNYFESGPRELLETFIELEADRMGTLARAMTLNKLDTQREVVRNERRQRYENRPYGAVQLVVPANIYPAGHPYHDPVIGSHEDLEAASVEDVKDFFRRFYFPGNASLVVAGDLDPTETRALIEKHFGPLEKQSPLQRAVPETPRIDEPVRVTITDRVELPLVVMVWHSPAFYAPGDADMDVLAGALAEGKASRLYRSLVYQKKLAQSVNAHQISRALGSEFWVNALARPGVDLDELEGAIDAQLETLRRDGPNEREVTRARNKIEMSFWGALESLGDRADLLNRYQFSFGTPDGLARDRARYEAVTPESAREWARRVLDPESRLVLRVLPEPPAGAGETRTTGDAEEKQQP